MTFRKLYQAQGFVYNELGMTRKRGRQTEGYLRLEEVNFHKFRGESRCPSRSEILNGRLNGRVQNSYSSSMITNINGKKPKVKT